MPLENTQLFSTPTDTAIPRKLGRNNHLRIRSAPLPPFQNPGSDPFILTPADCVSGSLSSQVRIVAGHDHPRPCCSYTEKCRGTYSAATGRLAVNERGAKFFPCSGPFSFSYSWPWPELRPRFAAVKFSYSSPAGGSKAKCLIRSASGDSRGR